MSAVTPGQQVTLDEAFSKATEDAQAAESAAPPEDDPEDADELPCGHAAIYAESGTCMVCEPAFGTAADGEAYREQNPDIYGRDPLA